MSHSRAVFSDADAHRLVEHFNEYRPDALAALARRHGRKDVEAARLTGLDEEGIVLRLGTGRESESLRVPFNERVSGPDDARARLEQLLAEPST